MKKAFGIIPMILVIALVVGVKYRNKSKASAEVKGQAVEFVTAVPGYSDNKDKYDKLFQAHHEDAFSQAYSMGGRYSAAKFNWTHYKAFLLALMAREATSDGDKSIADALASHANSNSLPGVDFGD